MITFSSSFRKLLILMLGVTMAAVSIPAQSTDGGSQGASPNHDQRAAEGAREYLGELVYTVDEVDQWLAGRAFPFCRYDAELGWLVLPMRRQDGADDAICDYNYDGPLGARRVINWGDRPCRISTYGNSFTNGDQVSDGETWQERLAAHIGEPIRNYGVGGYSVYQAYLRMMRVERQLPSELIVLNIFEDDHYRNLDAWRAIRVRKNALFIEPTLPHLRVDLATGLCAEVENPCPTVESVRRLCDPEWVYRRFKDDFVLAVVLAHRNARLGRSTGKTGVTMDVARTIGINTRVDEGAMLDKTAQDRHTRAALTATMHVVDKVREHARAQGKKLLIVLSYRGRTIRRHLEENDTQRFDQEFVEYLNRNKLPFVDLMEAHVRDFMAHAISPSDYIGRYYIGHYNPAGNYFTTHAIKDKLVEQLQPPPPAYRLSGEDFWKRK